MCGIVGYVGKERALPILLDGLKRLEYRGYDSAGVAVVGAEVFCKRATGKVANLEEALGDKLFLQEGTIGIAHTRWATHGGVTEANAHPHASCRNNVFLAHNGIIENWKVLREELRARGHVFRSETDTEVLVHLIEEQRDAGKPLMEAVRNALHKVKSTYGIAVVDVREPGRLIAARNSSPLVLGIGNSGNIIASDASAVVDTTNKVVYLKDGELAEVLADSFRIETMGARRVDRAPELLEWSADEMKKGGHEHFMHKEICETPETVLNSSRGRLILDEGLVKLGGIESIKEELRGINRIIIGACGTAAYAGHIGEYMIEEYAGVPVEVDVGSEFRYRKTPLDPEGTILLAISQSGETADTLAAVREAKEKGVRSLGIVNVVGSTIARETGVGVYNHAGPEISVASTKAFISQMTILALLTVFLGRQRAMSLVTGKRIVHEIQKLPALLERVLEGEGRIRACAEKYRNAEHMMFLGRKYNYPLALEGALKLKETAYVHAEGQPAGEFKHGSIALVDKHFPSFFIVPQDSVYEKTLSNMEEVKARGGPIIALTTEGNNELASIADDVMYVPKTLEMLTPILAVVPLYLFAYHIASLRGNDVDKPRNLAKSVTVE